MEQVINQIRDIVTNELEESGFFLVDASVQRGREPRLCLLIDSDKGISLTECAQLNRNLHMLLSEKGILQSDRFGLEVSSPGLTNPFKVLRQYRKNLNRKVTVLLRNGERLYGMLVHADDNGIVLSCEDAKGNAKTEKSIPHPEIKETTLIIQY